MKLVFKSFIEDFVANPYLPPLSQADLAHLQRWSVHPDAEEAWRHLFAARFSRPPTEKLTQVANYAFVNVILAIRRVVDAEERVLTDKRNRSTQPDLVKQAVWELKRTIKNVAVDRAEHPAFWRAQATLLRTIADIFEAQIQPLKLVPRLEPASRRSSRRQRFSLQLSEHLNVLTG